MATIQDTLLKAIGLHQEGRFAEAEALYRAVLQVSPDHPDALHLLGVTLYRLNRPGEALAALDRALEQAPVLAQAHFNRGNVLRTLGRHDEAAEAYGAASTQDPGSLLFAVEHGQGLLAAKRPAEAAEVLTNALSRLPADTDPSLIARVNYLLGEACYALRRPEEALAAYRQALVYVPAFGEAYQQFATVTDELHVARRMIDTLEANRRRAEEGLAGPAPNIYLKAYSRPFYLDRMIHSIKRNVTGYGSIIILNDGLSPTFMDKITRTHPDVEVRNSPKVLAGVIAAPASDVFLKRKKFFRELDFLDPARFWWREISKDPNDYILAIDEDCWFFRDLDLGRMVAEMRRLGCLGSQLMFEKEGHRARRKQKYPPFHQGKVGSTAEIDYYRVETASEDWQDGYGVFPNTQNIVLKEYYVHCYQDITHFTNEMHLNLRALRLYHYLLPRVSMCIAQADAGLVKHSMSSTSRSDAGGNRCLYKIDPDLYHDLVSELWLAGDFDSMADFPDDYSTERLVGLMRGRIDEEKVQAWLDWRIEFLRMFHWL